MKKYFVLLLLAFALIGMVRPAEAAVSGVNIYSSESGVNTVTGKQNPVTVGIIPTGTYSAAVSAALSAPTEVTIKALTASRRHVPVQCDFFLVADNATGVLKVELYGDTGSVETTLWGGTFDDAAKAGANIGFDKPKLSPLGAALKWRVYGQGGIQVRANCDYLTIK